MLVLVIIFVLAAAIISGLVISRKQRNIDRRCFSAFVGYVAGAVALTALLVGFLVQRPYPSTTRAVFTAIAGCTVLISWLVMTLAGLFSRGVHRGLLLLYGIMIAFDLLLIAVGNFGN